MSDLKSEVTQLGSAKVEAEAKAGKLQVDLDGAQSDLTTAKGRAETAEAEVERLKAELAKLRSESEAEARELREKLASTESERDALQRRVQELDASLAEWNAMKSKAESAPSELDMDELRATVDMLRKENETLTERAETAALKSAFDQSAFTTWCTPAGIGKKCFLTSRRLRLELEKSAF